MEKSRKPKIRFKGFTDDWEQRELNELALFNPKDELPQTFEYVDLEAVVGTEMLSHRTETRSSAPSRAQRLARAGDLFYQTVRPYQKNNYLFKKHDNNYVFSTGYAQMRPYVDGYFLFSLVQSDCFVKVVLDNCTGTSYPAINANDLAEIEVISPLDENETQKIGAIFHSIDSLITLHQRKLEKLMNAKKSMLEKMFPKQGSIVPEVRFSGFTEDWEQRKLSGILCEKNERTSDFNSFPLYSLTIENGITPKTDRYERSSLVTKTEDLFKIVNQNEFVTNPMNLRFGALGYNKNPHYISVSGYYDVFSIDNDKCSAFWNSYFKTVSVMTVFDNAATGSLIEKRRVKYSTLKQITLLMPIELREKQKIGLFFEDIDELITLHQRKLEKLKNIKKSMLEKMFI